MSAALDRIELPTYAEFAAACRTGLAGPFGVTPSTRDERGWDHGAGYPPSYFAFGRLRSLLALGATRRARPTRVLEVAAGDGRLAASLVAKGVEVVVNDLREETIEESLARYGVSERVRVAPGDFFQLSPTELGPFDFVVAREVVEHVAHPDQMLAHLSKFLTPSGRIYLTTPNGLHLRNKLPTFSQIPDPTALESSQFKPDADGHLYLLTPLELRDLAAAAGLRIEEMGAFGCPLVSGHVLMARLAGSFMVPLAYAAERSLQLSPTHLRAKMGAGLTATLALAR